MRVITIRTIGSGLLIALAGAAAASPDAGSGTIQYRATATYSDGSSADRLYAVAAGDLDGDGVSDTAWLRVRCDGGAPASLMVYHEVKSPRDAASGMATGKRMHRPFTITKEWGPATPMLAKTAGKTLGWNLKENKGARSGHAAASDASAGKGAKGEKPKTASYDVKKVEGSRAKTMAQDDWHEAAFTEGSPNLCD